MRGDGAWAMLTGLMDASVADIARITADGRHFDRQMIVRIADIWDNNTRPLFGVAGVRPGWLRERAAARALRWMAGMGAARRSWMIGHGGEPMRRLLDGIGPDALYYRDSADQIVPSRLPLAAAAIDVDYDLGAAVARGFALERRGRELGGHVTLKAPRRYADGDAEITVYFDGVRDARLNSADSAGVAVTGNAEVRVGATGLVRAAAASVYLEDREWHRSRSGQIADALMPRRDPRNRREPPAWPLGAAGEAADRFYELMIQVRMVRYSHLVGRIPLAGLCAAVAGAGSRVRAAADMPRARRAAAFGEMAEQWRLPPDGPRAETADRLPEDAWLTLASVRDATVTANFARPGDDWQVGAARWEEPGKVAVSWADDRLTLG